MLMYPPRVDPGNGPSSLLLTPGGESVREEIVELLPLLKHFLF